MAAILVVREFDVFSRILQKNDYQPINCPTVRIEHCEDLSDFEAKLLKDYDGVFITSRNAAEIFRDKLRESNKIFRGGIYVLGARSFDLLKDENLDLKFSESANTAEEMLAAIPPEELRGKRFLFVRGEKSLRVVPDFLAKIGADLDETIVYRTVKVSLEKIKIKEIERAMEAGEIVAACFFSPSAAESFLQQFDAGKMHQTKIATIGQTTADFFARRNLRADFVASKAAAEDFANELIDFLGKNERS